MGPRGATCRASDRASMSGVDDQIQMVRDEFSRLRAHLFEMVEAAGMPNRQERGFKGVIRTVTYNSQTHIESEMRTESLEKVGG